MRRVVGVVLVLVFFATAWWMMQRPAGGLTIKRTQHCAPGAAKDEIPPFQFTVSAGEVVTHVCMKAGPLTFELSSNGSDGCYAVSGLGVVGGTVEVTGGGTSRTCKDISYVIFYTGVPTPTPTSTPPAPTPTATPVPPTPTSTPPAPTPTATPVPPTPTSTPPAPTPTATLVPPTPTSTPLAPTPTATLVPPTPTNTSTPTPTVGPTNTPTPTATPPG